MNAADGVASDDTAYIIQAWKTQFRSSLFYSILVVDVAIYEYGRLVLSATLTTCLSTIICGYKSSIMFPSPAQLQKHRAVRPIR